MVSSISKTSHNTNPSKSSTDWSVDSWRNKEAYQMPVYNDQEKLADAERILSRQSPLVFAGECRELHNELAKASEGKGFLIMGGDCAESFDEFNVNHVRDTFKVILQMALILTYGAAIPITKVGRMAGQFAKPRSDPFEIRNGIKLPSYRGDIVNGEQFTKDARENDPYRMIAAYHQSSQTLNILRAFATGGFADINRLHAWNLDFVKKTEPGSKYRIMAEKVDESLRFMKAIGVDISDSKFKQTSFYTAHECLLLPYEQALTRIDSTTDKWYDCSSHMLWVGERTRQLDAAHLEFVRGIENPLGVKISDKCSPDDLLKLLDIINPENVPGRVTLITRMSAEKLRNHLPILIKAVQKEGRKVLWISDPVHGNTIKTESGYKTRPFDAIRAELRAFFDVHAEMGTHPGGMHIEMTGEDVTECIGGSVDSISEADLSKRYNTYCDPRLNGMQSLELAFLVGDRMRKGKGLPPLV
eukprot:CAMPEP_0171461870 /NCGR_PEP_ID=MMETSP0945-20130129/6138_1 /TAXON_ID=109269 /ORGANISM="Vaucheria litorea, Strain CCMP2940" /LENGTH=471 /DNA_ID=CAMNT_0011988289 /DNA_START=186 /DNA_END=1601 /DNA_ORIENTATION=+